MGDLIIGIMWNKNEGDILEETIKEAFTKVDSLFISDDGSTDNSWSIIQRLKKENPDKIEYIRNKREDPRDAGQRQSLLSEVKKRYKPENTWVQIIESDIMILDTNIKQAIKNHSRHDIGVSWQTLNAVRKQNTWAEADAYPNWGASIKEVMPYAHWMEVMLYTFRPLPKLRYDLNMWRPWPQGWQFYTTEPVKGNRKSPDSPLLAHYGFRGPTHYYNKNKGKTTHRKYTSWDLTTPKSIEETVYFFNGQWNSNPFEMSREGWKKWRGWK